MTDQHIDEIRKAADKLRQDHAWATIPLKPSSKESALDEGHPFLERKATEEELASFQWGGVGIVTGALSGLIVVDADTPEAAALLEKNGHPPTPMVLTQRGGRHLYFRHPQGVDLRTRIGIRPGLDIKAAGGYVVAPPSRGAEGVYEWIISPEDAAPADLPSWLLEMLEEPRRNGKAPPVEDRIPEGRRNDTLTSIAGSMRRRGLGEDEIYAALAEVNRGRCVPPLKEDEVRAIARSVSRYEPAQMPRFKKVGGGTGEDGGSSVAEQAYDCSDLGNAERFIAQHGDRVRWCPDRKLFLIWDGQRWAWDEAEAVIKLAQRTARSIFEEAAATPDKDEQRALAKFALASQNTTRISGMLTQAKPHLAVRMAELDADAFLFNVQNGTLDLRTGELRDHDPEDLISKISPASYRKDAQAGRFEKFLKEILVDEAVIDFVQRFAGYSLTGDTRERCMPILYGGGKNGKTTLVELLTDLLGDYAKGTDVETILAKRYGGVGNDVAALKGARFVPCSEVEKGRRLAEAKVKAMTGRDTVTARFLFCEPFSFRPEFKVWLSTNNKPEIKGTDDAIWDRIRLVPFTQRFVGAKQDKGLAEELRAELDGVLAWAVEGCLAWQREGLAEPEKVTAATQAYRTEQDVIASFIDDACVVREDVTIKFSALHKHYEEWCDKYGEKSEKKRAFSAQLNSREHETYNGTDNAVFVRGLTLLSNEEPPDGKRSVKIRQKDEPRINHDPPENEGVGGEQAENEDAVVNGINDQGQSLIPENSCKSADHGKGINQINQKTTTSGLKTPREERIRKKVNLVNSLIPEDPEDPDVMPAAPATNGTHSPTHEELIQAYLDPPPEWFERQAEHTLRQYPDLPEPVLKNLASSVAYDALGDAHKAGAALPLVREWLEARQAPDAGEGEDLEWLT